MATAGQFSLATTPLDLIDQPQWAATTMVSAYGVRVRIRTDDVALVDKLIARLPPASRVIADADPADLEYSITTRGGGPSPIYVAAAGAMPIVQTAAEATLLAAFESAVQFDVAVAAAEWAFVHAGVVAWKGAAIVMPAPSMHGKSRLVDALVRAGATYYSDEFAILDACGLVHPFRIPLTLRTESGGARRVTTTDAAQIPPVVIRLVVSTQYEPGCEWRPRRGTPAEALLALFANTVRARLAPRETLDVLARAVEGAAMLASPRGSADSVVPLLLEAVQ